MTKDEVIRMAREAGFTNPEKLDSENEHLRGLIDDFWANLERFAALVAAAEREACKRALDAYLLTSDPGPLRARGEKK
jgi:hypothetical protein